MIEPLYTERLDLEPVRPAHAAEVWTQVDDDRMWTYFPALRPATRDDLRATYAKWERGSLDPAQIWLNWLCRERTSKALVAAMQATVFPAEGQAYLAYAVYVAHQRRGYAAEAARCVISHLREAYGITRIFAEMDMRNEPSFRLAESLGFVRAETRETEREYLYELASAPLSGKSDVRRHE